MIIALTGKKGSGKNTAALIIQQLYPEMNFKLLSFAEPLKEAYEILFGEVVADDLSWKESPHPVYHITRRRLLQDLGKFGRDNSGGNIFIDRLFEKIEPDENYIITDLRFKNELYALIRNYNKRLLVLRIVRSGLDRDEDISEVDLDNEPLIEINNNYTLEALRSRLSSIPL